MAHYDVQYEPEKTNGCAVVAVLGALALSVSFFMTKQFEKNLKRDLKERYPTAVIMELTNHSAFGNITPPKSTTVSLYDTEYKLLFKQNYTRKGFKALAYDPDENGYPARTAARSACLTQLAALELPKTVECAVQRYPNDLGFSVFTTASSQDDITALLDAMQPENVRTPLTYNIVICSPELYTMFGKHDFSELDSKPECAYDKAETAIGSAMTFIYAFPQFSMSGGLGTDYVPEHLRSYTDAVTVDPSHTMVEITGKLGQSKPKTNIRLITVEPPKN